MRRGFIDLMAWCHEKGILAGVTTNGSALFRRNAARLVAARPFNVNVSVDAPIAELHDHLRGAPGLFAKLSEGIRYLIDERLRQGVDFPIIIKPTINAANFRYLPALVEWTTAIGATSINPQPMDHSTPETYDELWIPESDLPELERVIQQVIAMKRAGAPILPPEPVLTRMSDHFRGRRASPEMGPCRVGLRNFIIKTNGDVEVCTLGYPSIGNIRKQSAREIWYSDKAREVRQQTVACGRLCLSTASSTKTVSDKVKMGLQLFKGRSSLSRRDLSHEPGGSPPPP
jgi:MoaA/NifB/PqqE/SkfB family radical SAM enzyme